MRLTKAGPFSSASTLGLLAAVLMAVGACSGAAPPPGPDSLPSTAPTPTPLPIATLSPQSPQPTPSVSGCDADQNRPRPVEIRKPAANVSVKGGSLTIEVHAKDDVGVTKVEFLYHIDQILPRGAASVSYDPPIPIATRTEAPYIVNWSVPKMCAKVSLYAYAYDECNNVGEAPLIPIEICN